MKRFTLLKTMLLLCALIVGSGSAWGVEEVYYTLDGTVTSGGNSNYSQDGGGLTQNGMNWSVTGNTTTNPWRIGGKSLSGVDREAYSKTAMGDAITKVELVLGNITLASVNSIKLIVASNSTFSSVLQEIEKTSISANTTLTFNPSGDNWAKGAFFKLVFNVTESNGSNSYVQVKSVKFYHTASASTVLTPTFNPVGGTYTTAQSVAISCGTTGATIHYTTNGEDPTTSDATYSSAVSITTSGTVLKAKAFKDGMTASSIASATYTIKPNQPTISVAGATITITGDIGCTFYYTINGDAPDNTKTKYTDPFDLDADCTIKAKAYDTYGNASDMKSLTFKYMPLAPKNINSGYFVKVTDASTLENGDAILIVNESDKVAMSTTQNTSNRGQTTATISEGVIYAPSVSVQKLTLVKLTETISSVDTDVFYFYTGEGYLYAASNSSNHLKTETTPDGNNNARATVSIESGNATIMFTGANSRKWLKYNGTSDLFSCYKADDTDQSIVQIYKEVAHDEPVTISAAKYATFCSPYKLDYSGTDVKAYMAKSTGSSVKLTEVEDGIVPANAGVVLYSETANTYNIPVTSAAGSDYDAENNELVGINVRTSVAADGGDGKTNYILSNEDAGVGFYKATTAGAYLAAHRAYLSTGAAASRSFLGFDDETTGIETINANRETVSGVQEYYNLNGQRVTTPTKGLYIVNGKKVIINK